MPGLVFLGATHVDNHAAFSNRRVIFRIPELDVAFEQVGSNEAGHVDRVFGRAIGRGIGQFQHLEVIDRHVAAQGCGEDVYAFVHAVVADDLRAEYAAVLRSEQQLDMHGRCARIVAGVSGWMQVDLAIADLLLFQGLFRGAGGTTGDYGRALG